jgi:NitT/TauT family transport system ATP-binding protein
MTATSTAAAITVDRLSHAFYDTRRPGEFVCIVGPSGCGKTTVLRLLAGLEATVSGQLSVAGGRPAMVFQQESLFPWLTVEANVAYPLRIRGQSRRQWATRIDDLLEITGLRDFAKAYPYQLSGGMKQRVSLARAFADDRTTLLMDEPFGALDEQTRLVMQQELLRVWERTNKTVVFITHSVEEALVLSDRVLVMSSRPGRIINEVPVDFARPRNVIDLRHTPAFSELAYTIWCSLRGQTAEETA